MTTDTKTIHEFLAENPNVDVSEAWERCFGILEGFKNRIAQRFAVQRHPSCDGREFYTSPTGPSTARSTPTPARAWSGWCIRGWATARPRSWI